MNPLAGVAFDASPDAVIVVDEAGTIVLANDQAKLLFGYDDELVGTSVEQLIPMRLRSHHRSFRATYAEDPRVRPMGNAVDIVARRKDGTEFAAEISLSPLPSDDGTRQLTAASVHRISRRAAAERRHCLDLEQRLHEAELQIAEASRQVTLAQYDSDEYHRALAHYTQLVRHRVANPLHIIRGMANTLRALPDLDSTTRMRMLAEIEQAAMRLGRETIFLPDEQSPEEHSLHPRPFS